MINKIEETSHIPVISRAVKGSRLTFNELDANFNACENLKGSDRPDNTKGYEGDTYTRYSKITILENIEYNISPVYNDTIDANIYNIENGSNVESPGILSFSWKLTGNSIFIETDQNLDGHVIEILNKQYKVDYSSIPDYEHGDSNMIGYEILVSTNIIKLLNDIVIAGGNVLINNITFSQTKQLNYTKINGIWEEFNITDLITKETFKIDKQIKNRNSVYHKLSIKYILMVDFHATESTLTTVYLKNIENDEILFEVSSDEESFASGIALSNTHFSISYNDSVRLYKISDFSYITISSDVSFTEPGLYDSILFTSNYILLSSIVDNTVARFDLLGGGYKLINAPVADNITSVRFGNSLSSKNGLLFISDSRAVVDSILDTGCVYIFDLESLSKLNTIINEFKKENDRFGNSISCSNDNIIIGSPGYRIYGASRGAIFVYTQNGIYKNRIISPNPSNGSEFGRILSVAGNRILTSEYEDPYDGIETKESRCWLINDDDTELKEIKGSETFGSYLNLTSNIISIGDSNLSTISIFKSSGTIESDLFKKAIDASIAYTKENIKDFITTDVTDDIFANAISYTNTKITGIEDAADILKSELITKIDTSALVSNDTILSAITTMTEYTDTELIAQRTSINSEINDTNALIDSTKSEILVKIDDDISVAVTDASTYLTGIINDSIKVSSDADIVVADAAIAADVVVTDAFIAADVVVTDASIAADIVVTDAFIAADVVVTDAFTDADIVVTNAFTDADVVVTNAFIAADIVVTDAFIAADVVVTDAFTDADIVVTNAFTDADSVIVTAFTDADEVVLSDAKTYTDDQIVNAEGVFKLEDETNGAGIIINNRTAENYGNIGLDAFDISLSENESDVIGATGLNSFSGGLNSISSHTRSFVYGESLSSTQDGSITFGKFNIGNTDSIFEIGNGADADNKSNILEIKDNGLIKLPLSNTADMTDIKIVITKEYSDAADVVVTDAFIAADVVVTDAFIAADVVVTDAFIAADVVVTDAFIDADVVVTDAFIAADVVVTDAFTDADVVVTDAFTDADVVVTDAFIDADVVVTDAFIDADEVVLVSAKTYTDAFQFTYIHKNEAYEAAHLNYIYADTSSDTFDVTLPESPIDNTLIIILDVTGSFSTNSLNLLRNGKTIMGDEDDVALDVNNKKYELIYTGSDWRII